MTQTEIIAEHLKVYGSITTWEAFERYGITRLSAQIYLLKKEGYDFTEEWITKQNRYGKSVSFKKYILEENK